MNSKSGHRDKGVVFLFSSSLTVHALHVFLASADDHRLTGSISVLMLYKASSDICSSEFTFDISVNKTENTCELSGPPDLAFKYIFKSSFPKEEEEGRPSLSIKPRVLLTEIASEGFSYFGIN